MPESNALELPKQVPGITSVPVRTIEEAMEIAFADDLSPWLEEREPRCGLAQTAEREPAAAIRMPPVGRRRQVRGARMSAVKLTGKTKVAGVFGDPVEHSLSPLMHNAAFRRARDGLGVRPLSREAGRSSRRGPGRAALGIAGVNVTVPHKVAVMEHLDEIDEEARLIGAVNTSSTGRAGSGVQHRRARLFAQPRAADGQDAPGRRVLIVGAGGRGAGHRVRAWRCTGAGALRSPTGPWKRRRRWQSACACAGAGLASGRKRSCVPAGAPRSRDHHPHHFGGDVSSSRRASGRSGGSHRPGALWSATSSTVHEQTVAHPGRAGARGARSSPAKGCSPYQGAIAFELITGHGRPRR